MKPIRIRINCVQFYLTLLHFSGVLKNLCSADSRVIFTDQQEIHDPKYSSKDDNNINEVPGFANYFYDGPFPSMPEVHQWFSDLNVEAIRQGVSCYRDMESEMSKMPKNDTSMMETIYEVNRTGMAGHILTITKRLMNPQGETVQMASAPSAYTCKYWTRSMEETCFCHYKVTDNPQSYMEVPPGAKMYRRRSIEKVLDKSMTLNSFNRDDNPTNKLRSLTETEMSDFFRQMWSYIYPPSDGGFAGEFYTDLKGVTRQYPDMDIGVSTNYTVSGNRFDGYVLQVMQWTKTPGNEQNMRVNGLVPLSVCKFNMKTREGKCAATCLRVYGGESNGEGDGFAKGVREPFAMDLLSQMIGSRF